MDGNTGISARELLLETFNDLQDKLKGKKIDLPRQARALIADDSDWHRIRRGFTGYESAVVLEPNEAKMSWVIAFGTKCGSYPADPYNCDIAAVSISTRDTPEEQLAADIYASLRRNTRFRNSLIYAMADGEIAISKRSPFIKDVLDFLQPRIEEFIAQNLEVDPELFTTDFRPVVKSAIRYKREFVPFLSETFQAILAK